MLNTTPYKEQETKLQNRLFNASGNFLTEQLVLRAIIFSCLR